MVHANVLRSLTDSSDDERCKEPCSLLNHLPDMIERRRKEKENKNDCCCNRGIVMVQLEAGLCLLFRHLIGNLLTLEVNDRSKERNDRLNKNDGKSV